MININNNNLIDISSVNKVVVFDYTRYDEERCRNGGAYGFETTYSRLSTSKMFEISYWTTAANDSTYCSICGQFGDNCGCERHSTLTEDKVLDLISNFESDNEDYWIGIE